MAIKASLAGSILMQSAAPTILQVSNMSIMGFLAGIFSQTTFLTLRMMQMLCRFRCRCGVVLYPPFTLF
jgi:hypothetical protein